ncbi:hypothetical protein CDCA_CDCA08G2537 [Cyanidium caldarium]|uniref:Uncharacterized protein n=1 Tax=Cyanidium caldarium TaxID=2771 RepID=A0AAV9IW74_CYACA|nr:hypothetical protein CDCA_CDCA08G2537 [Cyanidium caldarium]
MNTEESAAASRRAYGSVDKENEAHWAVSLKGHEAAAAAAGPASYHKTQAVVARRRRAPLGDARNVLNRQRAGETEAPVDTSALKDAVQRIAGSAVKDPHDGLRVVRGEKAGTPELSWPWPLRAGDWTPPLDDNDLMEEVEVMPRAALDPTLRPPYEPALMFSDQDMSIGPTQVQEALEEGPAALSPSGTLAHVAVPLLQELLGDAPEGSAAEAPSWYANDAALLTDEQLLEALTADFPALPPPSTEPERQPWTRGPEPK